MATPVDKRAAPEEPAVSGQRAWKARGRSAGQQYLLSAVTALLQPNTKTLDSTVTVMSSFYSLPALVSGGPGVSHHCSGDVYTSPPVSRGVWEAGTLTLPSSNKDVCALKEVCQNKTCKYDPESPNVIPTMPRRTKGHLGTKYTNK